MKKRSNTPTALDRIVIETCERKLRSTDGREMSAIAAMVSRDAAAALHGDDQATRRIRTEYARACERKADRDQEDREWAREDQRKCFELFATAERLGLPPPDLVPHPTHVRVTDDEIIFTGPITAEERAWWEAMKADMRWWMDMLAAWRRLVRPKPGERGWLELRKIRAHIERIRRAIPPGWNWKESIYTLGSSAEELARYQKELELRLDRASPEIRRKIDDEVASWRFGRSRSSRASLKTSKARGARMSSLHPA
jgi:hypothetical protein